MKKIIIDFVNLVKELPYLKCDNCSRKGVRFLYEDHFGSGQDVYECKYCKHQFI